MTRHIYIFQYSILNFYVFTITYGHIITLQFIQVNNALGVNCSRACREYVRLAIDGCVDTKI